MFLLFLSPREKKKREAKERKRERKINFVRDTTIGTRFPNLTGRHFH